MFAVTSAEIRWFIKGKIPLEVFDWFIGLNENYVNQAERTDYYLNPISDDSLGIKLREGRVEVKQRLNHIGNIAPGENVAGIAEKWQKWSFELKEADHIFSDSFIQNKWLPVNKTRILVNYGITEDNIVAKKEKVSYKNGCLTELTSVLINKKEWWTLGLEAYGEENRLLDNLVLISHLILNDKVNIRFSSKDSLSYPSWLKRRMNNK